MIKEKWLEIILVVLGIFIAYQLIRIILGGSWQSESLIIALLVFNLGLTWKINENTSRLNAKFEGHIGWHKGQEKEK